MKRIIHMSDLHVGCQDFDRRLGAICDNLIAQKGSEAGEFVIVITGDLVDNAHASGYLAVKKWLDYLRAAGFRDILVVPGNHDYGTGKHGNKKFVERFRETFHQDELPYPRKDIIDDIAFIGLDSMAEELHFYDRLFSEGELGSDQLRRLEGILNSEDVRRCRKRVIYLHHHPFDWRILHQLKDSRRLKELLTQTAKSGSSIDALLYGHNHQGKAHNGQWGIARCYDGGTATLKTRWKYFDWFPFLGIRASTRLIDLEQPDPSGDCLLTLFSQPGTK